MFSCRRVTSVGFTGRCLMCQSMPARLNSEFCEVCGNRNAASSGTTGYHHPSAPTAVLPRLPMVQSTSQDILHPSAPQRRRIDHDYSVPEGLGQTCQECRRPMIETRSSRYCSEECEEASLRNIEHYHSVPEGLGQTCQECRRPMIDTRGGKYCSKECEEASPQARHTESDRYYSVPEGLVQTCQECRLPIKGTRSSRCCSKACEDASLQHIFKFR